jgi:tetratricopeptide (TPR) repeat protein
MIDLRLNLSRRWLVWSLCLAGTIAFSPANALCGGPLDQNNFSRPIDVNNPKDQGKVNVVVRVHFTPEVAALIRGSTAKLPGDIHYTLRHIPNHYGALDAMARFQLHNPVESSRHWTVDCYFERALAFRPKDPRLYLLYGIYLHRARRPAEAAAAYTHAEQLGLDSPELYYNHGLLEFERNNYEVAAEYASKAYAGGYPLPALRDKLQKVGVQIPAS